MHKRQTVSYTGSIEFGAGFGDAIAALRMKQAEQFTSLNQTKKHVDESLVLECCHESDNKWMMQLSHDVLFVDDSSGLSILHQFVLGLDLESVRLLFLLFHGHEPNLTKCTGPKNSVTVQIAHSNVGQNLSLHFGTLYFTHEAGVNNLTTFRERQNTTCSPFQNLNSVLGLSSCGIFVSGFSRFCVSQQLIVPKIATHFNSFCSGSGTVSELKFTFSTGKIQRCVNHGALFHNDVASRHFFVCESPSQ
mmetsp:Transcript_18006/g.37216  ORF Transcript_18006/g.37216 Transcript_18006/m.37216 type:complete len:248 (-) Transcript_18006:921-1664(-)